MTAKHLGGDEFCRQRLNFGEQNNMGCVDLSFCSCRLKIIESRCFIDRTTYDDRISGEVFCQGINLQFAALVVNYDLPWNPQRVEQRIGRVHRYGQKHDVVVINFLNRANEADLRVFDLLSEKFKLFSGVFGSSDEVLGAQPNQS